MIKSPITDFDKLCNKLTDINSIRKTGKSKNDIQQEAIQLWTNTYKNRREELQLFLDRKIEPRTTKSVITSFFQPITKEQVKTLKPTEVSSSAENVSTKPATNTSVPTDPPSVPTDPTSVPTDPTSVPN